MPAYFYEKRFEQFLYNNRPSAVNLEGKIIFISDIGVGGSYWISNGTTWRAVNGKYLLDSISNPITTGSSSSYSLVKSISLPANLIKDGDKIVVEAGFVKSGTVDTHTFNISIGPLGSSSDPTSSNFGQPSGSIIIARTSAVINFFSSPGFISTSRNATGWGTSTGSAYSGSFDKSILNYISVSTKFTTGGIETATYYELDVFHLTGGE